MICAGCQADLGRPERVGRRDTCPRCATDLRVCRQCRFHDPRAAHGCREPQAEPVLDPTRANFCDYFSIGDTAAAATSTDEGSARAALDRLFKR